MASGSSIGARAKKIVGCTSCSYGEPYAVLSEEHKKSHGKTGAKCPRCHTPSIRVFDSAAEFTYANELRLLQNLGHISDLNYQVKYDLHAFNHETSEPKRVTSYIADFVYVDTATGLPVVVDVKGGNSHTVVVSPEAKMKMAWMKAEYGIDVQIIGR